MKKKSTSISLLLAGLCCLAFFTLAFGWIFLPENPTFGVHRDKVEWLPPTASDVCYFRARSVEAYEFRITAEALQTFAISQQWQLRPIVRPFYVDRFIRYLPKESKEFDLFREADPEAEVMAGVFYEKRQSNGGGISVGYDEKLSKAFVAWSAR
ncbi:MAG: hypothetical protein JNM99_18745 [Verrucomicrobiaceae bacterium]|nr:hypothetical protein [Verrucomicrobiaceae bacterium]